MRMAACSRSVRVTVEQALIDASAEELEKAHAIIAIMRNCLSGDAKREMALRVAVAGLDGEGATRANERERLLLRLAVARVGRSTIPVPYAHAKLMEAALLARRELRPLLAEDLSTMASALAESLDAAAAIGRVRERTPDCARLLAALRRLGASEPQEAT